MTWKIEWDDSAVKQLRKLDKQIQKRIIAHVKKIPLNDPRKQGKPLTGDKAGLWRYRMGEYRIVCSIIDHELVLLIVGIGHRKEIYN